jgi:hypothetical protein
MSQHLKIAQAYQYHASSSGFQLLFASVPSQVQMQKRQLFDHSVNICSCFPLQVHDGSYLFNTMAMTPIYHSLFQSLKSRPCVSTLPSLSHYALHVQLAITAPRIHQNPTFNPRSSNNISFSSSLMSTVPLGLYLT